MNFKSAPGLEWITGIINKRIHYIPNQLYKKFPTEEGNKDEIVVDSRRTLDRGRLRWFVRRESEAMLKPSARSPATSSHISCGRWHTPLSSRRRFKLGLRRDSSSRNLFFPLESSQSLTRGIELGGDVKENVWIVGDLNLTCGPSFFLNQSSYP